MRCREAREKLSRLINSSATIEEREAVSEHLKRCPACAQLALAERLLAMDLEQIRQVHPPRLMTVEQVRERIAIREQSEKKINWGVRIMKQVSETVYRRPRISIASAAVIVLLLASIIVPVRTEHPVGYEIAFAAPASGFVLNQENAEKMLAALDMGNARVRVLEDDSGIEYRIAPLEDSAQVQRLMVVLDSLGGQRVRSVVAEAESEKRTIWQLLLDDDEPERETSTQKIFKRKSGHPRAISLDESFKDDFILWMPTGDQQDDKLSGVLMDRKGEKTEISLLGVEGNMEPDGCGWNQLLNNSVLKTETPDGERATFYLYRIEDVRKLEKMGYNFVLMEFDTPGQIPIPGMGPELDEIEPNPFTDEVFIRYMVPEAHEVTVQILDEHRRDVCTLLDCIAVAGIYQTSWDGRDADGNPVEPGTYLCRFVAGEYVEIQELELLR